MIGQSEKRCLSCGGQLHVAGLTEQCAGCGGTLVSAENLLAMYLQMRDSAHVDALPLVAATSTAPPRTCPGCATLMPRSLLEGIELDYCEQHGFWFDPDELQGVLQGAGDSKPSQTTVGFWRGLLDLFVHVERREGARRHRPESEDPWFWLDTK